MVRFRLHIMLVKAGLKELTTKRWTFLATLCLKQSKKNSNKMKFNFKENLKQKHLCFKSK